MSNQNVFMQTLIEESQSEIDAIQNEQLYTHVNGIILDAILKYTSIRKLNEASWDINDFLSDRIAELGNEMGLSYYHAWNRTVGSHGEGLGLLGNDIDRLCINRNQSHIVSEDDVVPQADELVIERRNCYPGYCRLKFHRLNKHNVPEFMDEGHVVRDGRDVYLKSTCISVEFLKSNRVYSGWDRHGPALTNELLGQDFVLALRCLNSRTFLSEYLARQRSWPKPEVIEILVKEVDYTIVAASHPQSDNPSIEYRLSFAQAEKFLIRQMNDIQFAVYCYLKQIKHVIESGVEELELLRSYYIKTVVLWSCESIKPSKWTQENFLKLSICCVEILCRCYKDGYLPSLFISGNNLIGHITGKQRFMMCDRLASFIEKKNVVLNTMRALCDESFDCVYQRVLSYQGRHVGTYLRTAFYTSSLSSFPIEHVSVMMETESMSHFISTVFVTEAVVLCTALDVTISRILDVTRDYSTPIQKALKTMLYRFLGDCLHARSSFSRQAYNVCLECYSQSMEAVLPISNIDDKGVSGKTHLALFHFLNLDNDKAFDLVEFVGEQCDGMDIINALSLCVTEITKNRFASDPFLYGLFLDKLGTMPQPHGYAVIKYPALALYIAVNCNRAQKKGRQRRAKLNKCKKMARSMASQIERLGVEEMFDETLLVLRKVIDIIDILL